MGKMTERPRYRLMAGRFTDDEADAVLELTRLQKVKQSEFVRRAVLEKFEREKWGRQ